jgi:hypothetical protein
MSLKELRDRITHALQTITADMVHRVWDEFDYRLDVWPWVHPLKDCDESMRNLDSCRCWRCTLCPRKMRNKFLVNFWNRTILLCVPCIRLQTKRWLRNSIQKVKMIWKSSKREINTIALKKIMLEKILLLVTHFSNKCSIFSFWGNIHF